MIGGYPNIEGPQDSLIIFIKLVSIGYGFCLFFMLVSVFLMFAEKMKEYSFIKLLANISFYGVIASGLAFGLFIVFGVWGVSFNIMENDDSYYYFDDTPSEWGPGVDNGGGGDPGYHNVEGHYRSDGTYVKPYIRSNPDGSIYNNINP